MNPSDEEMRQQMIAQGRDYLDATNASLNEIEEQMKSNIRTKLCLVELKLTWLERLAAMMRVNITRQMHEGQVRLVFADTDFDPVIDEETGEPVVVIESFDDISSLVVSVPKSEG
tara:strand:+ start:592 stop:936 length:345 start_codon:yes stop_codon:yes gene_type:complete